jgi:hypothetical protein
MSQAGPGPGFGFLDLEHARVVRAPQLHVHRLAAVAVADRHGASLGTSRVRLIEQSRTRSSPKLAGPAHSTSGKVLVSIPY